MDRQNRLEELIAPMLESMGYEMVRVQFQGKQRPTLQVMAERRDAKPMTVDDCADISQSLSAFLDVEEPIAGAYVLEVSSPGIDRPLTRITDFDIWAGHEAKMESVVPVDGRKRFRGTLLGNEDGMVRIRIESGEVKIPFDDIRSAKLVLTDALIAAVTRDQEGQG